MKLIFLGDIFGKAGKEFVIANLKTLRNRFQADLVIANAENVSKGGKSLIYSDYQELLKSGIDYFTMGNHTFHNNEINDYIDEVDNLVRPANYVSSHKGRGYLIFKWKGKRILLFNLLGMTFMNVNVENPFFVADKILDEQKYDFAILDFHAETTSEKIVLANYLKDRVNLFVGTHTHVQTADQRIIGKHTAYITDLGMCGVVDSAIGMDFKPVLAKILGKEREPFYEATEGMKMICGLFVDVDLKDLSSIKIESFIFKK